MYKPFRQQTLHLNADCLSRSHNRPCLFGMIMRSVPAQLLERLAKSSKQLESLSLQLSRDHHLCLLVQKTLAEQTYLLAAFATGLRCSRQICNASFPEAFALQATES